MPVEIQTTGEDEELMYSARQAQKNDFWSGYALYRPTYKESFFRRIYEYHAEKSGTSWSTAHDVGAGHGIVSSTLADKFNHVIVSEPDKEHSEFSRQLLVEKSGRPESKFTFLQERIEESSVETGTVDLITACECMHFTNTVKAVDEFARQLKPGGTLVMTLYTPPLILGNDRAQSIWKAIFDRFFEKSNAGPVFERACRICTAAYDSIAIPPAHWEAVKRVYINASQGIAASFGMGAYVGEDNVGADEERVWVHHDSDWSDEQGVDWLKKYIATWLPVLPESEVQEHWDELERITNGVKFPLETPLVMVFATKRA